MLPIFNAMGSFVNKVGFGIRKHSPELLTGIGIANGIATVVFASIATVKSVEAVSEAKVELEAIKDTLENKEEYTEEAAKNDRIKVYTKTSLTLAKNYAPAVATGTASVICICAGANILNKRNSAIAASCATALGEFAEYRKHVVEKYGEEVDKELRHGLKEVEVKEKLELEDGKSKTVKRKLKAVEDTDEDFDGYRRIFDPRNPYWDKDQTYCEVFLSARQAMFNDRLRAYGYVFLNDVLEELGFPKTRVGQEVGWVFDPNKNDVGDNYIDFGITPVEIVRKDGTGEYTYITNGTRNSGFILDFNVDGSVLNRASFPDQK